MTVRRIVPNLPADDPSSTRSFFEDVIGLDLVMDLGWIASYAAPGASATQLSVMSQDASAADHAVVSIEVADVDAVHAAALERGLEIVHPLTTEEWGVRRFFVRDPAGNVVNVLAHAADDEETPAGVADFVAAGDLDSNGDPVGAIPLYRSALAAGLDENRRRQATIQLASSLRNLGQMKEALLLLEEELAGPADEFTDAVRAFLALVLSDLGRSNEATAHVLTALAPHLPRYQRSVTNYAAALVES